MGARRGSRGRRKVTARRARRSSAGSGHTYRSRDALLRHLGFKSYAAYLRSPLWKSIKAAIPGKRCCIPGCPNPSVDLHHLHYERWILDGTAPIEVLREVIVHLCRSCHIRVEFSAAGNKLPMYDSLQAFTLLRATGIQDWEAAVVQLQAEVRKRVPSELA